MKKIPIAALALFLLGGGSGERLDAGPDANELSRAWDLKTRAG